MVASATLALVAAVGVLARSTLPSGPPPELKAAFAIDASRGSSSRRASAEPAKVITMHFADGSDLSLIAGARGRLAGMSERGGSVVLEDGEARATLARRPGAQWVISAGPFVITSAGATLDVRFSPDDAELVVRALEGSAIVSGPASPGGAGLSAGEELRARGGGPLNVARSPEFSALEAEPGPSIAR